MWVMCWILETTPDSSLVAATSPCELLFGGELRTPLGSILPQPDKGVIVNTDSCVEEHRQALTEVRNVLDALTTKKALQRPHHQSIGRAERAHDYGDMCWPTRGMPHSATRRQITHEPWFKPRKVTEVQYCVLGRAWTPRWLAASCGRGQ